MRSYDEEKVKIWYDMGVYDTCLFTDFITRHAEYIPKKPAIVDQPNKEALMGVKPLRFNWSEVNIQVNRLALNFLEIGFRPEDIILVQLPNSVELYITEMALHKIGVITVPVPMRFREAELEQIIQITKPVHSICMDEYYTIPYCDTHKSLAKKHPFKEIVVFGASSPDNTISLLEMMDKKLEEKYEPNYLHQFRPSADDIMNICPTSGSEAASKLCPRTTNSWKSQIGMTVSSYGLNANSVYAVPMPFVNMGGLGVGIFPPTIVGAKIVCHDPFDTDIYIQQISEEKINHWTAVVMFVSRILDHPKANKEYDITSLKIVGIGGEPVPPILMKEADDRGLILINAFGATEGWGLGTTPDQSLESRTGSFSANEGWIPGFDIKAIDPGTGKETPPGEDGELAVRGPNVMAGYYNSEELNKKSYNDEGFFLTGDLVRISEDRVVQITGRIKDMIIRSGQNISPAGVEDIISQHPDVTEVGVIGIPDKDRGEMVCAFVVPKPGREITKEAISTFMREKKVASFKIPERIEIRSNLPMGPTGKILKQEIRNEMDKILKKEGKL